MAARLAGPSEPSVERASAPVEEAGDAVAIATDSGPINAWPDETAESAFRSDARARGETVTTAAVEIVEETSTKALPPLEELVKRLPPAVHEALENLFRAKFITVRRIPKQALKG